MTRPAEKPVRKDAALNRAAVLEAARLLRELPLAESVWFVLTDAEEEGSLGSAHLAEARAGHLRLFGRESIGSRFRQSLVARRWQSHCFTASTVVEFEPQDYHQMAGLVCYYIVAAGKNITKGVTTCRCTCNRKTQ